MSSNLYAARSHGIDESLVRKWRKDELKMRDALDQGKTRFRLDGGGRKAESINIPTSSSGGNIPENQKSSSSSTTLEYKTDPYYPTQSSSMHGPTPRYWKYMIMMNMILNI